MGAQQIKLSFIAVNYNGLADTRDLIKSILNAQLSFSFEIIIIDNASRRNEYALLKQEFPFIKGNYSAKNLGFAGGNNLGIQMASGEYMYFVNNDTILPVHADEEIVAMLNYFSENPQVGGLTPKLLYVNPINVIQFAGSTPLTKVTLRNKQIGYGECDRGQYNVNREIPYMHGAAMLVPSTVVREIGAMEECYFLYYEELDWSCKIRQKYKLFYFAKASIFHKESATTGKDSPLKVYYITRNRMIFAYRNRTGVLRWLAITYLICVANCWQILKLMGKGEWKQALSVGKATKAGIWFFIKKYQI